MDLDQAAPCAQCAVLPRELWANTGRDEYLPAEASKLVALNLSDDHDLRRCTACGAWFEWQDHPQMYGSGNNWEESLRRLEPAQCRLIEQLLEEPRTAEGTPAELDEVFDTLHGIAWLMLRARDRLMEHFLPAMVTRLCTRNEQRDYQLLYGWAGSDRACRERILALLRAHEPLPSYAKYMQEVVSRP